MSFLTKEEQAVVEKHNVSLSDNFIIVYDAETKKPLFAKNNLVTLKGRAFALRKIFNSLASGVSQDTFNQRSVCLFGIGTGGTPVSNPFSPTPPTSRDTDLNTPVPFRIANTANGTQLTSDEQTKYTDGRTSGSVTNYFKKTFNSMEFVQNEARDEAYIKLGLEISAKDARGALVSELALYSAKKSGNVYADFEIFSRITFQTEALNETLNKSLLVNYYLYC